MNNSEAINVLKGLVIDGVNQAKSGHPGGALSSMDFAYYLFTEHLQHDPEDSQWLGRDRFILSAGHESMLIYSMLHMQGFLPLEQLKKFRQLHSLTPGHPENYLTPGVECTTGPLGQGAAMSVGFASASAHLSAKWGSELFGNKTWVILGDGCMQEGVTLGAASMAGHLGLEKLIWYYDRNHVQISGRIDRSQSDDMGAVFRGFNWNVLEIDGHNADQIRDALDQAQKNKDKPLLIIGDTTICKGAHSLEGSEKTHGAPLPPEERRLTKEKLGLPAEDFYCPPEVIEHFRRENPRRAAAVVAWKKAWASKQQDQEFASYIEKAFGDPSFEDLPVIDWEQGKAIATRSAFGKIIEKWAEHIPNLMGGSADLEPSNMTGGFAKQVGDFGRESYENRNLAFGVREFPMSAMCNGMALYGGIIPFDATFLTFADYSRPALRLGAIQKVRVIHEFTHDSFFLGEDGPTHQPVEHVMSLRAMPNFYVMRPADAIETEILMKKALELSESPSALCLSRQNLPLLGLERSVYENAQRGAYIISDVNEPDMIIYATGGEVSLALATKELLKDVSVRVISVPCWELFDEQDENYRQKILSWDVNKKISIEAGVAFGWERFIGNRGLSISLDRFGDSAPASDLAEEYGFTAEKIAARIRNHSF